MFFSKANKEISCVGFRWIGQDRRKSKEINRVIFWVKNNQLHNGDVYINKIVPEVVDSKPAENLRAEQIVWKDQPAVHKGANPATVDRIILTTNYEVLFLIKVNKKSNFKPNKNNQLMSLKDNSERNQKTRIRRQIQQSPWTKGSLWIDRKSGIFFIL